MRRLSFKLPVVFRYSVAVPVMIFLLHKTFTRKKNMFKYYAASIPLRATLLCYEEILTYQRILFQGKSSKNAEVS